MSCSLWKIPWYTVRIWKGEIVNNVLNCFEHNFDLRDPLSGLKDILRVPRPHLENHYSEDNLIFPSNGGEGWREIGTLKGKAKC